jgi:hypothetical protein
MDFVRDMYNCIVEQFHRTPGEGIYETDILYDVIPTRTDRSNCIVWWMEHAHPLALMMLQNGIMSIQFDRPIDGILAFHHEAVMECRASILKLMRQDGLIVHPPKDADIEIVIHNEEALHDDDAARFAHEIYDTIIEQFCRSRTEGIYTSDMFYDMIPIDVNNNDIWWWMEYSHPFALLLQEQRKIPNRVFDCHYGKVVAYQHDIVIECRREIIALFERMGLNVIQEKFF